MGNEGLSEGDWINLKGNPLSEASLNTCIPQLQGRGVNILLNPLPLLVAIGVVKVGLAIGVVYVGLKVYKLVKFAKPLFKPGALPHLTKPN